MYNLFLTLQKLHFKEKICITKSILKKKNLKIFHYEKYISEEKY